MTRDGYRFLEKDQPHFVTCTVVEWLPLFSDPRVVDIILDSLRFLQQTKGLTIYAYVVMENHLHLIASSQNLAKSIKEFKSFTATRITKHLQDVNASGLLQMLTRAKAGYKPDSEHQVWQEGSHPEQIFSEEMMWQKIRYIHANPLKRGYVDEETHWRYSSARNYNGERGLIDVKVNWRDE